MRVWTGVVCIAAVAVLLVGCNATSRYKVLSLFFDGVPPPQTAQAPAGTEGAGGARGTRSQKVEYYAHGPYAARLCNACHDPNATNRLVAPPTKLCFKCHQFKLDKKYVHGPLASGGCLVCHDPHSSRYRFLLVSAASSFCFHCHNRQRIAKVSAHQGIDEPCTACHNPHMSDKKYLLR
jgi:predicted CXXCH cytochrome family protein